MILTDNETKVDLLNNEAIATTIVKLLRARPEQPVTIGVHGDWGAGKSSVLEMIDATLDGHEGVLCLKFNGWRFQGFEDAKIALIEGIVTGLVEKRPLSTEAGLAVKDVFRRIDWLKVAKKAGGLALLATTGIPTPDQVQAAIAMISAALSEPGKLLTRDNVESALEGAKSLLKPEAETKNVPEEIGAFRKAFDELLAQAGVSQLVVLIDDLDRCLPETAIETLEAVRLFVFTSKTAFVVAADEAMIEYAVRKHFPDLPDTTGPRDYARNYLEKLIQVPFRIPALGEAETRIYVTLLLVGDALGANATAGYNALIASARERLRRPWAGGVLDATAVAAALGADAARAQPSVTLSDQIGPILARGARGNPRQIKRFLNTLLLRQRTAEARGFGDDVKLPVMAKLMLAERFQGRLFDQIATAAATDPNGRCQELAALEAAASQATMGEAAVGEATADQPTASRRAAAAERPERSNAARDDGPRTIGAPAAAREGRGRAFAAIPKTGAGASGSGVDSGAATPVGAQAGVSATLVEWLATPQVLDWARVQPSLAEEDLRPYLFVAKDRKDYFGATSTLGHLAGVVEQLLGPKLAVEAFAQDVKRLAGPEAVQVFDALRARILGTDSFETAPAGVDGLAVLVRAHAALQRNLLELLEGLPQDRLGPWAVRGWAGAMTEAPTLVRFDALLDRWATEAGVNPVLKASAASVRILKRGTR